MDLFNHGMALLGLIGIVAVVPVIAVLRLFKIKHDLDFMEIVAMCGAIVLWPGFWLYLLFTGPLGKRILTYGQSILSSIF
jgi:hypothetical protein